MSSRHWFRKSPSTPTDEPIRYERMSIRPPPWPKALASIRRATFEPRFVESAPAMSRRGSWVVQAVAGRIPIGYAWLVPMAGADRGCYVEEVAVQAGLRDRGVGSALILEAARWMSEQGYEMIGMSSLADAARARREAWFVGLGFVDAGGGMFTAATQAIL
jgi:ribosomal protein S18 acetylase RimI-like enzyme